MNRTTETALTLLAGCFITAALFAASSPPAPSVSSRLASPPPAQGGIAAPGADVVYTNCTNVNSYSPVGGTRAYALGSATCNIGTVNLQWIGDGPPALAMNAYRLHNGRLEQIGMSWCKTACCAFAGTGCGLSCNGVGGNQLGVGCMDVYDAGWNGIQSNLMARSQINAFSGAFGTIAGGIPDSISRRLQIAQSDLTAASFPGALYFVEGQYVATDDAAAGNALNNASHRRVFVDVAFNMTVTGPTITHQPAIYAWRDNGLGPGIPDPSISLQNLDVPAEGRFILAHKVTDNNNGTWTYDYAIYNFNSDRSASSLSIPIGPGISASSPGFHDVNYHSGEPYDNTDWSSSISPSAVSWSSPQTFAQNPNSNALRWGTMYNFYFTANRPPVDGKIDLALFKPGTPSSISFTASVPQPILCPADITGPGNLPDGQVNIDDLTAIILAWNTADPAADIDGDNLVEIDDLTAVILAWGACS